MREGCPKGIENGSSKTDAPLCGEARVKFGTGRPHCEKLADSTEEDGIGASGCREQVGPVQEQGFFGSGVSAFDVIVLARAEMESSAVR